MRNFDEIVERIKYLRDKGRYLDFFGFQSQDLAVYLPYNEIKELGIIRDGCSKEEWEKDLPTFTKEAIIDKIIDYLPFAWGKANNCRRLSAGRFIQHFLAWTWLIDDEFFQKLYESYEESYEYYGKPQLVLISEKYNFDWKKEDNNKWTNHEYSDGISAEEALKERTE